MMQKQYEVKSIKIEIDISSLKSLFALTSYNENTFDSLNSEQRGFVEYFS